MLNLMTDEQREQLMEATLEARKHAHAPYSNFAVGAAVLTQGGEMFSGCNIENASFGLTNCAERTAMFAAVANGHKNFSALAIVTEGGHAPCGACRQVMAEFGHDLTVLLIDINDLQVTETTLAELLPQRFDLDRGD
jgi:cytidine deaminase